MTTTTTRQYTKKVPNWRAGDGSDGGSRMSVTGDDMVVVDILGGEGTVTVERCHVRFLSGFLDWDGIVDSYGLAENDPIYAYDKYNML